MKRFLISLLLALAIGSLAAAQTPTVVTGTVTDVNGLAYANANISAQLIPSTASPTVTINGVTTVIPGQFNSQTNASGQFSLSLFCNTAGGGCTVISPSGTSWLFTVSTTGVQPPLGTGPQQCTATVTITGASQSLTSLFNGCPALSFAGTGVPPHNASIANQVYESTGPSTVPNFFSIGLPWGNGGAQIGSGTYSIGCDNATTTVDRGTVLENTISSTYTLPDPGTTGCGSNFIFKVHVNTGSITINRTTTATFTVYYGGVKTASNLTSVSFIAGQWANIFSPDGNNWEVETEPVIQSGISACSGSTKAISFTTTFLNTPAVLIFDYTTKGGINLSAGPSTTGFTASCTGATDAFGWLAIGQNN